MSVIVAAVLIMLLWCCISVCVAILWSCWRDLSK